MTEAPALKPLAERLREEISRGGPIRLDTYMAACLADPLSGYYVTRDPLGRSGDFITAPEASQVFGELIGLWSVALWKSMGEPVPFHIIELGPGRGTLLSDALRAMSIVPQMLQNTRCHLVEISAALFKQQQEMLANAPCEISWHTNIEEIEEGPSIVIANEFFDALPIRQFVKQGPDWHDRLVTTAPDGTFQFVPSSAPIAGVPIPHELANGSADGAIFETCAAATEMIASIAARAARHPLAALIIDYGHNQSGVGETLQAVRAHQYADPLEAPGEADITAHVDFANLSHVARQVGLAPHGPIPQGRFLLSLGLARRIERLLTQATEDQASLLVTGAQRLIDPAQMGELFKVLALTSPGLPAPAPFDTEV